MTALSYPFRHAGDGQVGTREPKYVNWTECPVSRSSRSQPAYVRAARVVSKAKSTRCAASARSRSSMIRLASIAALSGSNPDNPWAITSALT